MKKIIYANVIWFFLIMCVFIFAAYQRHHSLFWSEISDVRLNYDIYFIGVFGSSFLISSFGLLNKKMWGYNLAIITNNSLVLLGVLPILHVIFFDLDNIFMLMKANWKIMFPGVFISVVSAGFSIYMHRAKKMCL